MTYYAAASPELKSLSKKEDKALARLNTLKGMVTDYMMKVQSIQSEIKGLKEEKRRLTLIQRHIIDERFYKLDLNKLSAFGFEAVELG